jgi:YfiH family protein
VADPALPAPFRWEGEHIAADLPGAHVLFTTRRGGASSGPFASLNLGLLTDDDPANVAANRERLAAAVGLERERFLYGRQVHGTTVRRATEPPHPGRPVAEEDGQATALRGIAALVFVADCLPVMLAAERSGKATSGDRGSSCVAALHCGWRPLAGGIVPEGVAALRELGADGPVCAAIGPGARGCCYAVGEEVHAAFAGVPGASASAGGLPVSAGGLASGYRLAASLGGERNLDLGAVARHALAQAGVETVHDSELCTICSEAFFSHRRDSGVTGRQAGVVWQD